ncbi:MAG: sugar phosphate isomerase/epimerase [Planctomycetes bacterium]|nr:sugar phosphate isomerase/epimerase [Planctomycetota bacterium]
MKSPVLLATLLVLAAGRTSQLAATEGDLLASGNLAAWCVVPFDPRKRGPEERAQMLERLGITRLAYDWREEHVATFDAEITAMARHGIAISAWWYPGHRQEVLDAALRHGIHPQLWVAGAPEPQPSAPGDPARVAREAARILPLARDAAAIGSQVGLYNHREPWCEDQDNQLAVIERLRQDGITNVGMVFNFHHWRGPLADFAARFARMQPHLLAVNLNGMPADSAQYPAVRFIGTDAAELAMLRVIRASGWHGPIGLLHERPSVDAEISLACSLAGLAWLRKELDQPGSGGPQPTEAGLLAAAKH